MALVAAAFFALVVVFTMPSGAVESILKLDQKWIGDFDGMV
jgi:hypothetical protein